MKNRAQDIYETGHTDLDSTSLLPPGATQPVDDMWLRESRKRRRNTMFFSLIVAVFGILIGVIVVQQYLLTSRPQQNSGGTRTATREARIKVMSDDWDFDISPETEMFVRDLEQIRALKIPEDEDIPFDGQWIKQAAFHVVKAERAYEENELEKALEYYGKALRIFPELEGIDRYRGLIYLQLQDYEAAARSFQKETSKGAMSHGVLNNLGVAHLALKDYETAERYFLRALEVRRNYALAYLNLATLHVRAGNRKRAASYFKQYIALKPDDIKAAQSYANLLMEQKEWDEAIKMLIRIREQVPDLAPVYFLLAQAFIETNNREGAIIALRRGATLIDPRMALAQLSKTEFDRMRADPEFQGLIGELSAPAEEL